MDNSQKVLQKTKQLKDKVEAFNSLVSKWEDTLVLIDLANEENDESMLPMLFRKLKKSRLILTK